MISVVTNTRYERPELLERCRLSVQAALPPGARHEIIPIYSDWGIRRYESLLIDEYVAVVDDDDTIHPDSIKKCIAALEMTGAGFAFTNEVLVDESLNILGASDKSARTYVGVSAHPRAAHHLGVYRSSAISPKALELHNRFNLGIDWFATASAVFSEGGAVYVPMDGYYWTRHDNQDTIIQKYLYDNNIGSMGVAIRETFKIRLGRIPEYNG